jgi:predicted membrane protein
MSAKLSEIIEEFRTIVLGRSNLFDTIVPPVIFVIANTVAGFDAAMVVALGVALVIAFLRWRRQESLIYALGGIVGVVMALGLSVLLNRAEGFFLPGIVISAITTIVAVISNLIGRPMVAWTSYIAHRWPWEWYLHQRVRPVYSEVTWFWAIFFGSRLLLQTSLFQNAEVDLLAWANLLLGWPATAVLLVVTYLYGSWRLQKLGGPSVEEFQQGTPPPWQSQKRGF